MAKSKRKLTAHVEFKTGGDFDFRDVISIGFNNEQKLVIDFSKTRYTEDVDKIKRVIIMAEPTKIIIVPSKKKPHSRSYVIEVEYKGRKPIEKGQSEDKKEL